MTFPYQIAVGPNTGTTPTTVVTFFDGWTLDENLDDGATLSFTLPADTLPGISITELETDVWVYYGATLYARLRVAQTDLEWDEDGRIRMAVSAVDYRRILNSRYVQSSLTYTGVSQGQIVWNLISHTQAQTNGSLGITLGSAGPAILRDRTYAIGDSVFGSIAELGQIESGIVWEIDGNKVLTVDLANSSPINPQPVVLGANARRLRKPSGAALFANVALASGDSQTTVPAVSNALGLATDPRGRWEKFQSIPRETDQANLVELAEGIVEVSNSPAHIWDFEIDRARYVLDSRYLLGEYVQIVEPSIRVPLPANPTQTLATRSGGLRICLILTKSTSVSPDGALTIRYSAIEVPQRWDDVPEAVTWDSVDPSVTWDSLSANYLF